jgi:hypothetical protein
VLIVHRSILPISNSLMGPSPTFGSRITRLPTTRSLISVSSALQQVTFACRFLALPALASRPADLLWSTLGLQERHHPAPVFGPVAREKRNPQRFVRRTRVKLSKTLSAGFSDLLFAIHSITVPDQLFIIEDS